MSSGLKGGEQLRQFLAELPRNLERNILRGGLKAGADVLATSARERCRSAEVRSTIKTSSRAEPGLVTAKVQTKGPGSYIAPWLENGTDPHFISVDASQSGGMTVRKINRDLKNAERGSLVIGGKFVGDTVHHPGAKPYPFMRPAVDEGETAAIAAIADYISTRCTKEGLTTPLPEQAEAGE